MLLLSRLRRAVKKVRLLLNFKAYKWRIASMISRRSFDTNNRLSFNERPGLAGATEEYYYYTGSEDSGSFKGKLQRATSYTSDHDSDIDEKAELFIANFRRQLLMERQISLEVRYQRGNSFDWRSP